MLKMIARYMSDLDRACPGIWRAADSLRRLKAEKKCWWPDSVFLPMADWRNAAAMAAAERMGVRDREGIEMLIREFEKSVFSHDAFFFGSWRPSQDVIRFDPDVYGEILDQGECALPAAILEKLPAWCVFVEAPGLRPEGIDAEWSGFFAAMNSDDRDEMLLSIMFLGKDGGKPASTSRTIALKDGISIDEALKGTADTVYRASDGRLMEPPKADRAIVSAINLLVYVCAYGMDDSLKPAASGPQYPKPVKTKKGWRCFPPAKPRIREIGVSFGEMIREARERASHGGGSSKSPHVRRAHFHHYWTGARENQSLVVRWLHPMLVGARDEKPKISRPKM